MSTRTFTADLLNNNFPHVFRELGASIVYPDASETPQRQSKIHGADAEQQEGYNQVYYMDNVLPTSRGYASVAFNAVTPAPVENTLLNYVYEVRNSQGDNSYIGVAGSSVYAYEPDNTWTLLDIPAESNFPPQVVTVRGDTYLYFGLGVVYSWDVLTNTLVDLNFPALGITPKGICSGGSRLVVYDNTRIYNSAALDVTDFQPSIATGAQSTAVVALRGQIIACLPLGQDFIIYTNYNAVYARATDNFAFPFAYTEIIGSLGIVNLKHVAYNTNVGVHIAYTNAGFQQVTQQGASAVFAELSDGLRSARYSWVNPINNHLDYSIAQGLNISVRFIANRYLAISVGTDEEVELYNEAFIYDSNLGRWGRLFLQHTGVIEWSILPAPDGTIRNYNDLQNAYATYEDIPVDFTYADISDLASLQTGLNRQRMAVIAADGQINVITTAESTTQYLEAYPASPNIPICRMYLGRVKMFRSNGMQFQYLYCNKLSQGYPVVHGHDLNGNIIRSIRTPELVHNPRHYGKWTGICNADSISVEFRGVFLLTDCVIAAGRAGTALQFAAQDSVRDRFLFSDVLEVGEVAVPISQMKVFTLSQRNYLTNAIADVDIPGGAVSVDIDAGIVDTVYQRYRVYDPVEDGEMELNFAAVDGEYALVFGGSGNRFFGVTPYLTDENIVEETEWIDNYTLTIGTDIEMIELSEFFQINGVMQLAEGKVLLFTTNLGNMDGDGNQATDTLEYIFIVDYTDPLNISVTDIEVDLLDPIYGLPDTPPYYIIWGGGGVMGGGVQRSTGNITVLIGIIRFGLWATGRLIIEFSPTYEVLSVQPITPDFGGLTAATNPLALFDTVSELDYSMVKDGGYGFNDGAFNGVRSLNGALSEYSSRLILVDPEDYVFAVEYQDEESIPFDFAEQLEVKLVSLGYTLESVPDIDDYVPIIFYE